MKDYILVTNWEKVDAEDWYLSEENKTSDDIERIEEARKLQKEGKLYEGFIVTALNYCIYYQMDADKVFIDEDMNVIMNAESSVINNDFEKVIQYEL